MDAGVLHLYANPTMITIVFMKKIIAGIFGLLHLISFERLDEFFCLSNCLLAIHRHWRLSIRFQTSVTQLFPIFKSLFIMHGTTSPSSQGGQSAGHDTDDSRFTGYRWSYFASVSDDKLRLRVQKFIDSTNWDAVIEYASILWNGKICNLLPDIGLGYNHLVRIIEFQDDMRWIARLRMSSPSTSQARSSVDKQIMVNEYNTILLVRQKTKIPVPNIHAVELDTENNVKAQFMLMDCLRGNAGIDLSTEVPDLYKRRVFSKMAEIQVLRGVH